MKKYIRIASRQLLCIEKVPRTTACMFLYIEEASRTIERRFLCTEKVAFTLAGMFLITEIGSCSNVDENILTFPKIKKASDFGSLYIL